MPDNPPGEHVLSFTGGADAVRVGLEAIMSAGPLCDLPEDSRLSAELVLAEVMNNIVEHAYANLGGLIEVGLARCGGDLLCRLTDCGRPMPGGLLPQARDPLSAAAGLDDLPEGGFGWGLIRSLARDLHYERAGGQNHVRFRIGAGQSA